MPTDRSDHSPVPGSIGDEHYEDEAFPEKDKVDIMHEAYKSIRTLRLFLANHPKSKSVKVPEWLFKGEIRQP